MKKVISINKRYEGKEKRLFSDVINKFMHSIPYILFISLPLYALFLRMLYYRHKQFFVADHAIFLIHLYIFTFLWMLIFFGIENLQDKTKIEWLDYLLVALIFTGFYYTVKALKNFYEQNWRKTIIKFFIFNVLCLFTAFILFAMFLMFSFFQI